MTSQDSSKQPELLYDFAQIDLWEKRIGSIDDTVDATFKLLDSAWVTVGGLTVRKFVRLVHEAWGKDFENLIDDALREDAEGADARLAEALDQKDLDSLSFFLGDQLRNLLKTKQLSLSTPETSESWDADFELTQMLNLYMLIIGLNSFFWGPLTNLMRDSLNQHSGAQTPPPLYLIRRCFRLAGVDAEILQRAIVQRRWKPTTNGYIRSLQARSLVVIDKLTAMAMAPLQKRLPGQNDLKPLTYFSRETHIHQLPYSDRYVLVGLSYDLITPTASRRTYGRAPTGGSKALPAFELMAIPHEVGHFVYHHATLKDGTTFNGLSEQFKDNPYQRWCEEIFADVYGCMVAGPLTALGLQAILATGDKSQIAVDDGEHPTPLVRPFILSEILRELGKRKAERYAFAQAIQRLEDNWTAILTRWGFEILEQPNGSPMRIKLPGQADDYRETMINVQTVVETVRPMIRTFVRSLLDSAEFTPWKPGSGRELSADIPWSRADHEDLTQYDGDMASLTGNDLLYKAVPGYRVSDAGNQWLREEGETADERLENFVALWKDSGPTGFGGH